MSVLYTLFYQPIYNALIFLYDFLWSDLGVAIVALTIIIKILLLPMSRKQISSQKEMQALQPEIKKLQEKHKGDREKIARETMALYKERGVNPAAGCLPIIITLIFLFALFTVISNLAEKTNFAVAQETLYGFMPAVENVAETAFGFLSLGDPSPILGIFTAIAAYIQIRMMQGKKKDVEAEEEKKKKADPDAMPDFATVMQKQMLFIIPIITLIVGFTFPAGLTVYWFTSTIFTIGQQWFVMREV